MEAQLGRTTIESARFSVIVRINAISGPWSSHGRHTAPRVALTAEHVQVQGESPCMFK